MDVRVDLGGELPGRLQGRVQVESHLGEERQVRPEPGQHDDPVGALEPSAVLRHEDDLLAVPLDPFDPEARDQINLPRVHGLLRSDPQRSASRELRQTYSDGVVVNWNEVATGSAEPENAAPVLQLAAAGAGDHSSGGAGPDAAAEPAAVTQDAPGLGVGIAGIALAAVALVVAVVSLLRRRSTGESH